MNHSILLIGGGGHCRACIDVLEAEGKFEIAGIVEHADSSLETVLRYPVLGTNYDLPKLFEQTQYALVAIGHIKNCEHRKHLFKRLIELDFILPTVISPRAYVSPHAKLGVGTIVMHDAIVNAGAEIGENCILNSKSLIEHDVSIGNHCHIATGSLINGEVRVGHESFVGSGSIVREGIEIGARSFVAGGTRVMRDLPQNSNYKNAL
ncbi:MAG: acetyltransferase [Actinomycetota bacterium]|nr:acetyltransferase [Actinomycetota bacterium]